MSDTSKPTGRLRLIPGLSRANLARELSAGVTLLALSVPLNIGYAQIAGLPATAGLYALIVPSLLFALVASTRQVVVAPDAAAAALVASSLAGVGAMGAVGPEAYPAMAAAQAVIGGGLFLLCGRLRLGFLADFLSRPILIGFVGGLALEVLLSQVAKMLGIKLAEEGFFERVVELAGGLGATHGWSALLSAVSLALLIGGRRLLPAVPWALVVVVGATAAGMALDAAEAGIAVLGAVPSGLPELAVPDLPLTVWIALVPSALALTAVTVAEGLLVGRSYADQNGQPHDPDRDLTAFGLANIGAGLSSSFSVGSSTSRTAAMDAAGSRTQLPSVVLALGSLLLLLFGADLLADIPSPAIGATVAVAVLGLVGVGELRELWRISRDEFAIAMIAMLGVLVIGPIGGILLAFVLALVNLTRRAALTHVLVQAEPGVLVLRPAGPVFFANATGFATAVRAAVAEAGAATADRPATRAVLFDLGAVTDIDVTAAEGWRRVGAEVTGSGLELALSRVDDALEDRLRHLELFDAVPRYRDTPTALAALTGRDGRAR
ncbi:SulP family inorganic anion transporter [Nocardioides dubius]|uniref:SulP family inorganic anion transporter n=1 Tax=Nocardioides dubius TaxID=317019 RepID=A0ABN1TPL9_9ACTN